MGRLIITIFFKQHFFYQFEWIITVSLNTTR
ncbi:hypothetical protein AAKU61_004584 [Undibacterium sp. GrIS 1.2]